MKHTQTQKQQQQQRKKIKTKKAKKNDLRIKTNELLHNKIQKTKCSQQKKKTSINLVSKQRQEI